MHIVGACVLLLLEAFCCGAGFPPFSRSKEIARKWGHRLVAQDDSKSPTITRPIKDFDHDKKLTANHAEAMAVRTASYDTFVEIYEALRRRDAPIFPRNGFMIAVARDHGFTKWDMDIDVAILDRDCERFNTIALEVVREIPGVKFITDGSQYGLNCKCSGDCGRWRFVKEGLGFYWEMDGVQLTTDDNYVYFFDYMYFDDKGIREQKRGLPLSTFKDMQEEDFYCAKVNIPTGFKAYLHAHYGDSWEKVAINKCSIPNGPKYKLDPKHCEEFDCYWGAGAMPVALRPGTHVRGAINSAGCSGFEVEEINTIEDKRIADKVSADASTPDWARH